jgi:hypothetical protein
MSPSLSGTMVTPCLPIFSLPRHGKSSAGFR